MNKVFKLQFLLTAISLGMLPCSCVHKVEKEIVVQAHRGGAALYPENSIPAMINAVKMGMRTLELDLQITRDSQVVVSHDSYMNSMKVLFPNGKRIPEDIERSLKIFSLDYDSISKFDIGSLENPLYPRRKNLKCAVPKLTNLIDCIEAYTYSNGYAPVNYNIEIKSAAYKDGISTPYYQTFCDLSMQVLLEKNLKERLCIQSFDSRSLNYIHRKYPHIQLSYLVESREYSVKDFLKQLEFVPQIISPDFHIVDKKFVSDAHDFAMKVIPWTVDDKDEVLRLKRIGVDEIITNQPDSVQSWLEKDNINIEYKKAVSFFETLMGF